jgi:hypothetical protein
MLKMYDALYWILNEKSPSPEFNKRMNASRLMYKPWAGPGRIPRDEIMSTGGIQWCVTHAFNEARELMDREIAEFIVLFEKVINEVGIWAMA